MLKRLILALAILAGSAWGQSFYQLPSPKPGAVIRVCPLGTQFPCPSPVSVFQDSALSIPIVQPYNIGPTGQFGFWVTSGQYLIQIQGSDYTSSYVITLGGSGGGAVSSVFGRTGAVVAQNGDYTFGQIGATPTTLAGYGITDAVPSSRTVAGHPLTANVAIACGDLTNAVASCSTDATNASNISSGTLNAARLPAALSSSTSVNGTSIPASVTLTQTIASGSSALGTSAISSGTCATVVTGTATGTATTDDIQADFNADPTSTVGYQASSSGMLTIIKYPTTNTVNFKVCNNTANSITPGAVTLNWRVVR